MKNADGAPLPEGDESVADGGYRQRPTIGPKKVSKLLGVSVKALRIYESAGVLSPKRTASGHRVYDENTVCDACMIVDLRQTGMPIERVKRYAARGANSSREDLLRALEEQESTLIEKFSELRRQYDVLVELRNCFIEDCPPERIAPDR